jgi:metal-dependent hydrolase (beta-lactamase superfamily II)
LPPVDITTLNAVIITHAHFDHTGYLPLLVRKGYSGPVYATQATIEITHLILMDSVRVQSYELARTNRKRARHCEPPLESDYTEEDALLKDPDRFHSANLVFMESTYGYCDHCSLEEILREGKEIVEAAEDSIALNKVEGPCMIIAGAGMCN